MRGYEPSLGIASFGKQLVIDGSPEDIFFVGPLAGNIIDPSETKTIDENDVANANHNWRAWRIVEAIAAVAKERK